MDTFKPHYNKIANYTTVSALYLKVRYKGIFLTLCLLQEYASFTCVANIWLYLGLLHRGLSVRTQEPIYRPWFSSVLF